jgi:hypothetical protein
LHILVNSGTSFGNTAKFAVLWQTGCNFPGKMSGDGRYWEAEKGVPWGLGWARGKEGLFWGEGVGGREWNMSSIQIFTTTMSYFFVIP